MLSRLAAIVIGAIALTFAGMASATPTAAIPVSVTAPGPADYRISPEDTLDINVFQVPDLTRTVQVDASGQILLPLVGQVMAAGLTSSELSKVITDNLSQKYMKNPQVTVAVKDAAGQRVTVDGAVIQPGIYPIVGHTTLLQAVALAKGPDPREANIRRVSVFRQVGGARTSTVFNLADIRTGRQPDPVIFGNDIIVVDSSAGKGFIRNLSPVFPMLALFRPF